MSGHTHAGLHALRACLPPATPRKKLALLRVELGERDFFLKKKEQTKKKYGLTRQPIMSVDIHAEMRLLHAYLPPVSLRQELALHQLVADQQLRRRRRKQERKRLSAILTHQDKCSPRHILRGVCCHTDRDARSHARIASSPKDMKCCIGHAPITRASTSTRPRPTHARVKHSSTMPSDVAQATARHTHAVEHNEHTHARQPGGIFTLRDNLLAGGGCCDTNAEQRETHAAWAAYDASLAAKQSHGSDPREGQTRRALADITPTANLSPTAMPGSASSIYPATHPATPALHRCHSQPCAKAAPINGTASASNTAASNPASSNTAALASPEGNTAALASPYLASPVRRAGKGTPSATFPIFTRWFL